jgi:hypothetical protein
MFRSRQLTLASDRGIALITLLLVAALVVAVSGGLSLIVSIQLMAARNFRESVSLASAAEGAIELAAAEVARTGDWDALLSGAVQANGSDGPPSGIRSVAGVSSIDLSAQTALLNCGRTACTAAQMDAVTIDRPWAANNPRWQLFLYGPLDTLAPVRLTEPVYVVAWVADDARETDGDPARDGSGPGGAGAGVLRVRADAFGRAGGRRGIEAELSRVCRRTGGRLACLPGIRVQSWRDVGRSVP